MKKALFAAALLCVLAVGPVCAAKNIIIAIGDGMGFQHVDAGRYYLGGAGGVLCFQPYYKCPVKTNSLSGTTDSAAAATALATGYKVTNGVISQSPGGQPYETILETAKAMGKRTGLLTTVPITHATPAGFGAHEPSRDNYINIGNDYLYGSTPNLIFGGGDPNRGGSGYFSSSQVTAAIGLGYQVVYNYSQMDALNPATVSRAIGLYAGGDMTYEYDRQPSNTEPHLSQMVSKALQMLPLEPNGFFLMIEGGMIDHAAHNNDINRTTREVVEFHNSVQVVLNWLQGRTDTLFIVTADHETGGLTAYNQGAGNYPTATWTSGGHTSANVPLYILGPDSYLVDRYISGGTVELIDIYKTMKASITLPQPSTTSQVRSAPDNTLVLLENKIVTAVFPESAYIEEQDRHAGIKVLSTSGLAVGDRVTVLGKVTTPGCERVVTADSFAIRARSQPVPTPAGFTNRALGGSPFGLQPGMTGCAGFNNIGLLVRAWGKFTKTSDTSFTIDDGSGAPVKCVVPSGVTLNPLWSYVVVTGISTCYVDGSSYRPQIRVRTAADIQSF